MKNLNNLISLCIIFMSSSVLLSQANCDNQMDYTALRALYLSTDGDNWNDNNGWPDANFFNSNPTAPAGIDLSTWHGLACQNGRIIYLTIENNNLVGPLPSELGLLDELVELNLNDNNAISGTLPIELWSLTNLNRLYLRGTNITGFIPPAISGLASLEEIELSYNQMSGTLPIEITQLPNLYKIQLCGIGLSGPIPANLFNMTQLIELSLCDNDLAIGQLPSTIANLTNLEHLDLGNNPISGTIPIELWDLINLRLISLSDGTLTGQLPSLIGNLVNLEVLLLNNNTMTGPLPVEMKDLTKMYWMAINNNSFSGSIDDDFFDRWEQIHDIRIQDNQFSGDLPSSLGNQTSLRVALFNNNQFSGCFPYNYKNLCTNKDYIPSSGFDFSGNVGLGINDGDFDAFCRSEAGSCITTLDCHWIELTINTGTGPLFFSYTISPFGQECNGGASYAGEYYLESNAPNTSLSYIYKLEENWFSVSVANELYDGLDLNQTIEIKDHSTGIVIVPQTSIEYYFRSDIFPVCNPQIINQNLSVTNTNDSGPGSFRQAIIDSNCSFGKDEITILTTGVINLTSCDLTLNAGADCFIILPTIRDSVSIIGNGIALTTNTTGRLFNNGSDLTLKDLSIDNINYSTFQGGTGGVIWNGGSLDLQNVTLSNNFTSGAGAIYSYGDVAIENCTFSNNSAGDRGGALYIRTGSCAINHCTFTDNSSLEGAAIYTDYDAALHLENSIMANNHGDADLNLTPALSTNNTNLVGACIGNCPTFYSSADAQLGPLQDNGGVTNTHALQAGSPAIDALSIGLVLLDQRGYDVSNGEKDLGAYEFGGVDADGCDIAEYEDIDIMGNSEHVMAHLMVGGENTIDMNADVLYQAGQHIELKPGFEVIRGSLFEAKIGPCQN